MDLRSLMRWSEFRNFAAHSGPTMTVAGTSTKLAFLAVLFFIGAFFSWRHFHERAQQIERESLQVVAARTAEKISVEEAQGRLVDSMFKINDMYRDQTVLDWQRSSLIQRELRYPLFAWLLFFLGLAPFFLSHSNKAAYLAPICVVLEGIAFGSFEAVTSQFYPGITLLGLTLTAGLMLSIMVAFWLGIIDGTNPFLLCAIGVIGAIGFAYVATMVAQSLGYPVEYLHEGPKDWWTFVPIWLSVNLVITLFACREVGEAVEAGAPKWLEWRAAVRIFVSFLAIAQATRWFLQDRSLRRWRI